MQKAYLLLIPILIWGCEQTYDNVIDTSTQNYQVTSVVGIKDSVDLKTPGDSLLAPRIIFASGSELSGVYFNVIASDLTQLNSSPIQMNEVANNIYEGEFILRSQNPNGLYTLTFSVTGTNGQNKKVAESNFNFNNGQDNSAPVISNTVIDPDTVVVTNQPVVIFTSVEAADSNGQSDIKEVYFIVYRPDGSTNGNKIQLFDDGDDENGDVTAGDGIYSRLIQVDQSNQKGTYRFEFQAEDRSGALSNIINHFVLIQ